MLYKEKTFGSRPKQKHFIKLPNAIILERSVVKMFLCNLEVILEQSVVNIFLCNLEVILERSVVKIFLCNLEVTLERSDVKIFLCNLEGSRLFIFCPDL